MRVLDFASTGGRGRRQKRFDHFAARQNWMTMLSLKFGNHRPQSALQSSLELLFESLNGFGTHRRPVHERDHGSVAAAVKNFPQAGLQRAELPAGGIGID